MRLGCQWGEPNQVEGVYLALKGRVQHGLLRNLSTHLSRGKQQILDATRHRLAAVPSGVMELASWKATITREQACGETGEEMVPPHGLNNKDAPTPF